MSIGTPVFQGSSSNDGGDVCHITTSGGDTSAGDLICVSVLVRSATTHVTAVSDGTANVYTQNISLVSGSFDLELWSCPNSLVVANGSTITVTYNGNTTGGADVWNTSGIAISSPYDSAAANSASGTSSTPSATTGTLAQVNEIVFGILHTASLGYTGTPPSGFTDIDIPGSSANPDVDSAKIVSSTTAVTYNPSLTGSNAWIVLIAPFKGAPLQPAFVRPPQYNPSLYEQLSSAYSAKQLLNPSLIAVPVNNPPPQHPGRSAAQMALAAQAWQPEAWPYVFEGNAQPYMPRKLPVTALTVPVNNPPFSPDYNQPQLWPVIQAWQPDPQPPDFMGGRQSYEPRKLNPVLSGIPVINPPFLHPSRTAAQSAVAAQAWQPDPWPFVFEGGDQPYAPTPVDPTFLNVPANNPPFQQPSRTAAQISVAVTPWQPDSWPYSFMGGQQPYEPGQVPAAILFVPVNNPPFQHPAKWVQTTTGIMAWQPEPWPSVFMGGLSPYIARQLAPALTNVPTPPNPRLTLRNVVVRVRYVAGMPKIG